MLCSVVKCRKAVRGLVGFLALSVLAPSVVAAGDAGGGERKTPRPIRPYRHPYNDGLYSTIVTMINIGAPKIKKMKDMKVKPKGFKKDLKVHAILQERKAPLIVVLVGADGKANTPMGRLFPYWLDLSGIHVLSFDSTFRPTFTYCSRQGVTGNMTTDCQQIASVIAEFLKHKNVKDKVTRIGVLGYSLGGIQAMVMARMAAEKKLPFELSGALALSPPVKLQTAARRLDEFYAKDRWKYTMINMGKVFLAHEPVKAGQPIPFEPAFMRAGIGYLVREEFTEIVERTDSYYRLRQIPDEDDDENVNRTSEARAWGFTRFMERMSFGYWKKKGSVQSVQELWDTGDLTKVMTKLPPYAHAIICENDPLNDPADLEALKKAVDNKHLTIQKIGGHLGYLGSGWDYDQVMRIFQHR